MASTYFTDPVRAKDVQIVKLCQAVCYRDGCSWAGGVRNTWAEASADREQHLNSHCDAAAGAYDMAPGQ